MFYGNRPVLGGHNSSKSFEIWRQLLAGCGEFMSADVESIVIGAGVVGLAVARALGARRP